MKKAERFLVGETLKNDIGRKLNAMVDLVNREIKGDDSTIRVNEFGNVISISAIRRGGGGGGGGGGDSDYEGYFKAVKTTDTTVSIIDGAAPDSGTCGYYQHGIQHITVTSPAPIVVNQNGFICVLITYTTQYVFTFAFRTSMPTPVNGVLVRKIADVTFADGKINTITQIQNGVLMTPGVL